MGQVDEWGKLTNLTYCLNWEYTLCTDNFPVMCAHMGSIILGYLQFCETLKQQKISVVYVLY